jgi:cytochrome c553
MRNKSLRALTLAIYILPAAWAGAADIEAVKNKAQACVACHGADGNSVTAVIPSLAGQTSRYMVLQLRDFKEGRRKDPTMSPVAATLS